MSVLYLMTPWCYICRVRIDTRNCKFMISRARILVLGLAIFVMQWNVFFPQKFSSLYRYIDQTKFYSYDDFKFHGKGLFGYSMKMHQFSLSLLIEQTNDDEQGNLYEVVKSVSLGVAVRLWRKAEMLYCESSYE